MPLDPTTASASPDLGIGRLGDVADGIRKVLRVSVYTDCTLTGLKHIMAKRQIQSRWLAPNWSAQNVPDRTSHPRAGSEGREAYVTPITMQFLR